MELQSTRLLHMGGKQILEMTPLRKEIRCKIMHLGKNLEVTHQSCLFPSKGVQSCCPFALSSAKGQFPHLPALRKE